MCVGMRAGMRACGVFSDRVRVCGKVVVRASKKVVVRVLGVCTGRGAGRQE